MNAHSTRWFYSDLVVDGASNPLLATKISLGGLNRNVTEQKLDLLQFASGGVAKPCAGSAEILPDPNRVSEELLWAWVEFVSRLASETSFAVLLKPRYDDLPTSATLPFARDSPKYPFAPGRHKT
jgi:hypothetical protein